MKPSASFLRAKNARDAITPVETFGEKKVDLCQHFSILAVRRSASSASSEVPSATNEGADSDARLTEEELECAIAEIGQRFVEAAERAVKSNCFGDMGEASRLWSIQKHLIGLRSKEWVAKVEKERGLL